MRNDSRNDSMITVQPSVGVLSSNAVLRNTYMLLALTLGFSALTAMIAMYTQAAPMNPFIMLIVYFGLLFFVHKTSRSAMGLLAVFALTGFLGYTLGPILSHYISHFSNGNQLVAQSLGGTAIIFFGLSAYALTTKKDFSFMRSFLVAGVLIAFVAGLGAIFFQIPALSLAVSAAFMVISSGFILMQTSDIIHGGETNYILATVTIYVSLYNIFLSLLNLLSAFSGERD